MPSVRSREERIPQAVTLAAVGGFLDAYSFLAHGGVFANAQTGNVVLFGVELTGRHWSEALRHLPPLGAFLLGMTTVELLARARHHRWLNRPTRVILLVEAAVFVVVGVLPGSTPDVIATVAVAWAATLQVGTFRSVRSTAYNTTFTTGNLRSLVSESMAWLRERDPDARRRASALLGVVLAFGVGAVFGGLATRGLGTHAVLLAVPVLLLVLADIVTETRRLDSTNPDRP